MKGMEQSNNIEVKEPPSAQYIEKGIEYELNEEVEDGTINDDSAQIERKHLLDELRATLREHPEMRSEQTINKLKNNLDTHSGDVDFQILMQLENLREGREDVEERMEEYKERSFFSKAIHYFDIKKLNKKWEDNIHDKRILEGKLQEDETQKYLH